MPNIKLNGHISSIFTEPQFCYTISQRQIVISQQYIVLYTNFGYKFDDFHLKR